MPLCLFNSRQKSESQLWLKKSGFQWIPSNSPQQPVLKGNCSLLIFKFKIKVISEQQWVLLALAALCIIFRDVPSNRKTLCFVRLHFKCSLSLRHVFCTNLPREASVDFREGLAYWRFICVHVCFPNFHPSCCPCIPWRVSFFDFPSAGRCLFTFRKVFLRPTSYFLISSPFIHHGATDLPSLCTQQRQTHCSCNIYTSPHSLLLRRARSSAFFMGQQVFKGLWPTTHLRLCISLVIVAFWEGVSTFDCFWLVGKTPSKLI